VIEDLFVNGLVKVCPDRLKAGKGRLNFAFSETETGAIGRCTVKNKRNLRL
jgi:hypothetical protein